MKFCFSTYSSVLVSCKKETVTKKLLINNLIRSVSDDDDPIFFTDAELSTFALGTKNISPKVIVNARSRKVLNVKDNFNKSVVPLLDQNKKNNIVFALKEILISDNNIKDDTIVEYASHMKKSELIESNVIEFDNFLTGLFLYAVNDTKNKDTNQYVKQITDEFISTFDTQCISFEPLEKATDDFLKTKDKNDFHFEESVFEEARMFCIEFENDLHMLPICEIGAILNPKHKYITPIINAFNRKNKNVQKAILISESLKPFEHCSAKEIQNCLALFQNDIEVKKMGTVDFLYDNAKYFHRAIEYYSDYEPEDINLRIFEKIYGSANQPVIDGKAFCDIYGYIDDYCYGLKNHPEDKNMPPLDMLCKKVDFYRCDEKILAFWLCRFIISTCHYFYGFDIDGEFDEQWAYKDTVEEYDLTTLETLYLYATFMLYMSYGKENGNHSS